MIWFSFLQLRYDEEKYYDYNNPGYRAAAGHFTAVSIFLRVGRGGGGFGLASLHTKSIYVNLFIRGTLAERLQLIVSWCRMFID